MKLMQLNDVSKSFGAETIVANIKLEIDENDRIAIVGRNGAGKSTVLKMMAGELSYDEGEIFKPKNLSFGYLTQHSSLESDKTIWAEMLSVFDDLLLQQRELRELEDRMTQSDSLSDAEYEQLLLDYDKLQQAFDTGGGYRYEADIKTVLSGLNFQESDLNTSINELSGGQKTRLALGKLLLRKPELLILDEPTNHLDIDTMAWLENYLVSYPGAVAIVSHDRYFLDKTVSTVYEISRQHSKKYNGNYSYYLRQRALDYERQMKAYEHQQAEIKRMEDFVQRNIARASTSKRAQSKRKQLSKMETLDKPKGDEKSVNFSFGINRHSGNDVLTISNLAFQYDSEPVFSNVSFNASRGERIALVGSNGIGKTTLLKAIVGRLQPETGSVQIGANVQIGYFDQEQQVLHTGKTVLDELWDDYPDEDEKDVRTVLGLFLFSGDDVRKTVQSLSGGEKARLSLSKLMMQNANLLVLDEPTNHLDIDSKEVLEAAMMDFPGTIIFVSHDRYFINKIADKVVEMQPDGANVYLGDYDYYIEKKQEEAEIEKLMQTEEEAEQTENHGKSKFREDKQQQREQRKRQRRISELEESIEQRETELSALEKQMTDPDVYEDHEKALELTKQTDELKQTIEQLMEEWTSLQE